MTTKVLTIWKKETRGYATSLLAYVTISVAFGFAALIFALGPLLREGEPSMREVMGAMCFVLLAITPIVTMRLFVEEANRGTLELLLTSPVREIDIVLGKFLGVVTLYVALFVATAVFPIVLYRLGDPDGGLILTQYLGMLLASMCFLSVGIFASSITSSQVISAVIAYILLLTFWIGGFISEALPTGAANIGKSLGLIGHLENFGKGILDATDVFYYLAFTAIFLFLSYRALEARRWS